MKNKKGFTLVELLAVIVILGILLLIAVPAVQNIIASSRKKAFESAAKLALQNVESVASIETTTGTGSITACNIKLSEIKLERGEFGAGASGYIAVSAAGKATIYYTNDYYTVAGGQLPNISAVQTKRGTGGNVQADKDTTCTWYQG